MHKIEILLTDDWYKKVIDIMQKENAGVDVQTGACPAWDVRAVVDVAIMYGLEKWR